MSDQKKEQRKRETFVQLEATQHQQPATKIAKTDLPAFVDADIARLDFCRSLEECPRPFYPYPNPPPFICEDRWLDVTRQMIRSNVESDDRERVPPMCFARCSRGGKTRGIYATVEDEQWNVKSLVVSFNSEVTPVQQEEQQDPLAALTRRMAFAAYREEKTAKNFDELFRPLVFSDKSIIEWLGESQCVLLIDELNLLDGIVHSTPSSAEHATRFAVFLKKHFLTVKGRYLVFTTHNASVDDKLAQFMGSKSDRPCVYRALPLIPSLAAAQRAFDWPDLNARQAIFCGLVPGLLYKERRNSFPISKRRAAVAQFLKEGCNDATVLKLLKSLISGKRELIPPSLEELMDTSIAGKLLWIPAHMVYVLETVAEDSHLSDDLPWMLQKICTLFGQFKDAKTYGGDGWEALFGLVLLVRILTKQSDDLIDVESSLLIIGADYKTSFNQPIDVSRKMFGDFDDINSMLAAIPQRNPDGASARVAVYYPTHASFKTYDMFVVIWNPNGERSRVIGYQLKEGREIPKEGADQGVESFVVRGKAAQRSCNLRYWKVASDAQISNFFGESGVNWTPKKWKELKDSTG